MGFSQAVVVRRHDSDDAKNAPIAGAPCRSNLREDVISTFLQIYLLVILIRCSSGRVSLLLLQYLYSTRVEYCGTRKTQLSHIKLLSRKVVVQTGCRFYGCTEHSSTRYGVQTVRTENVVFIARAMFVVRSQFEIRSSLCYHDDLPSSHHDIIMKKMMGSIDGIG